jgi:hypothetical protein
MSKMGSFDPFGHFKHKIWPKEMSGVKLDSRPLKIRIIPNFLACRSRATYRWKDIDEGYNFALNLTSIGGMHRKLWTFKVMRIPIWGISKLQLGSPRTK